ncbi:MAG: nitrogen regulation protein NR(I) [Gammaproteobacteria bacterium]|nr:nitrogen regulation protein NR(I) [Gammaproteobacteria bacterium]
MNTAVVWVIDDDPSIRWVLEKALTKANMDVTCFDNADTILQSLHQTQPDTIITDIRMPGTSGLELLDQLNNEYPDLPVIIITAHSDLDSAVSSYQGGAFEYLPKPFDIEDAVSITQKACASRTQSTQQASADIIAHHPGMIGEAPAMQEVFRAIGRLAQSNITVLINGESGTGKELVANALHQHSPRATQPFIAINTAAIPKDLLESELFGHEKGAFTGANTQRKGRFEQADGGTLFLDEIGDMPADLQTRLLRVLADGQFSRVGGHTTVKSDVRIITATHQDLEELVQQGKFREDLFHRLNVIRIQIPSLRKRREDIPTLLKHFLMQAATEMKTPVKVIPDHLLQYLSSLDWPGNVRQLENTCRWLNVMAAGSEILMEDLPPELIKKQEDTEHTFANANSWESALKTWADNKLASGAIDLLNDATPMFEHIMIDAALEKTKGKRLEAARLLGWGRNTLTRKIKELGI